MKTLACDQRQNGFNTAGGEQTHDDNEDRGGGCREGLQEDEKLPAIPIGKNTKRNQLDEL